jgi:hypothetical protein
MAVACQVADREMRNHLGDTLEERGEQSQAEARREGIDREGTHFGEVGS